jgi:hypothetical protein
MRMLFVAMLACLSALSYAWAAEVAPKGSEEVRMSAEIEARVQAAGRPRLFFQAKELAQLREAIKTTHREEWEELKAAVDRVVDEDPPENRPIGEDPTRPGTPNDEMLWQRVFGYRIPALALVALLDSDPKYFAAARKWALKPGEYPLWGAGLFEGVDLAAGHELYGISLAYDWLFDRWSPEDRARLKQILAEHGKVMYEAAEGSNDRGWWKDTWRQNHAWCNYGALGVTAVALAGDEPGVGTWLAKAEWGYQHIFAELSEEGAYEEGVPYWGYGMESMIRFITAVRPYVKTDFYASPYLRKTHLFRLYMAGPSMGSIVNFGDGPTRDWHAIGPLLSRLAAEYQQPLAQWLAKALPERRDPDARMYELLWHDPALPAQGPDSLPTWHAFQATGFASARTNWGEDALTLHLRSGRAAVSHSHLDVNDFLLNAGGEWLLRDYGYGRVGAGYFDRTVTYFSNDTAGHNCLVIGGRNQRKDEASRGVITDAMEQDGVVWFRSDATEAYEGVKCVARELALLLPHEGTGKRGAVVVRDLARTEQPETFDFMLQPGGEVSVKGDTFEIIGEKARLVGKVLSPAGVSMEVLPGIGPRINVKDPKALRISAPEKATEMEFLVVLVPLAEGEATPEITSPAAGVVRIGSDRLVFSKDGDKPPRR